MIAQLIEQIGKITLQMSAIVGRFTLFLIQAIGYLLSTKPKFSKILSEMNRIGVDSCVIIALTGVSTGMVFTLQSYIGFQRVGGEQFIGAVVALGMIRELGPVLTGFMVTGRAASAMAAEIGTMRITEQIDALRTLRINVFQYLVIPRLLAGLTMLPCLALFSMIAGIAGGYLTCVYVLHLSPEHYLSSIRTYVELRDIIGGLIKASIFGLLLTWVGTYKGFYTQGGARGVGVATTQAVVISSISIVVTDYFLTKLIEQL